MTVRVLPIRHEPREATDAEIQQLAAALAAALADAYRRRPCVTPPVPPVVLRRAA